MNISIILPTFNRSEILKKTIQSVQKQTFENYELIIINDASNDNTKEMAEDYQKKDQRIKIINNIANRGCAESRAIGLKNSINELIVFIDDDDTWDNNKLMKQYNAIKHNNSDMVISDYYILNKEKNIYKKMNLISQNFKKEILKRPGPFFQCVMLKKELIELIPNPFDTESIPSEDWNFFIELSKLNPIITYIDSPLFTWKIHNENQSLDLNKEAKALEYIIDKHYNYIKSEHNKKIIADHYRRVARLYEKTQNFKEIKRLYYRAFKLNPKSIKNIFYYLAVLIGYKYSQLIIDLIRKFRGVPNA